MYFEVHETEHLTERGKRPGVSKGKAKGWHTGGRTKKGFGQTRDPSADYAETADPGKDSILLQKHLNDKQNINVTTKSHRKK